MEGETVLHVWAIPLGIHGIHGRHSLQTRVPVVGNPSGHTHGLRLKSAGITQSRAWVGVRAIRVAIGRTRHRSPHDQE